MTKKTFRVEFDTDDGHIDVERVKHLIFYVFRSERVKADEVKQQ